MIIKVVCIDNTNQVFLTKGKVYETDLGSVFSYDDYYRIRDDSGSKVDINYLKTRFMTLAEWRDKQIDSILYDN